MSAAMTTISIQAPEQLFFTGVELAKLLGFDRKTIAEWVKDGKFPPPIRVGSSQVWSNTAIGVWIAWQQVCPSAAPAAKSKNTEIDDESE